MRPSHTTRCRNRHCPKCQANARDRWLEARGKELLPTRYVHVVFTLPRQIAPLALQNKREIYGFLPQSAYCGLFRESNFELSFICPLLLDNLPRLTALNVDTSFYFRYRSTQNPDLGAQFPQLISIVKQPAIPLHDNYAIANVAAFHFAMIGSSPKSVIAAKGVWTYGLLTEAVSDSTPVFYPFEIVRPNNERNRTEVLLETFIRKTSPREFCVRRYSGPLEDR